MSEEVAGHTRTAEELTASLDRLAALNRKYRRALAAINDIRNSIIAVQTVNWSEHVYPLVAALNEAGYEGLDNPVTRANFGSLIERANKAEALAKRRGEALAFAASVIKSGERWTDTCENVIYGALEAMGVRP